MDTNVVASGLRSNAGASFARDGSQFDHLLGDNEEFMIGNLACRALHTPGHTPACMTYTVTSGDDLAAFVGDTIFMPDSGTARADFPGGDARAVPFDPAAALLAAPNPPVPVP